MNAAYLAEIERVFLAHAGRGLMLSPADLVLVEQWDRAGLPLDVVTDAIAGAFEQRAARPNPNRRAVRGLAFVRHAVEDAERAWRSRGVGASVTGAAATTASTAVPRLRACVAAARPAAAGALAETLDGIAAALSRFGDATPNQDIYGPWAQLCSMAEDALWAALGADQRADIESELESRLGAERRRADPSHFRETWDAVRRRMLRQRLGFPDAGDLDYPADG